MNKRNWLVCIVSIILLLSYIEIHNIYSQDKFGEKPIKPVKLLSPGKSCISCSEEEEISIELLGFTTLDNPYLPRTIQSLIMFQRGHPEVAVRGVLIMSFKDVELLTQEAYLWGEDIPVGADISLEEVETYGIAIVPTFIFIDNNNNRAYKIAGQPDLEQIYNQYLRKKLSNPK